VDAAFGRAYAYADTISGQIAQMSWVDGSDKALRDFRYDAHGRLGRMAQGTTAISQCSPPSTFDSDQDGWLCTPQTSFTPSRVLGFEYDRASNLRKQVDSIASVADTAINAAGNRMTGWGGSTYTYDLDGNIASRTDSSGTVNFVYGGDGLLRKVIAGSDTTCYEYNAFGQLAFRGRECGRNTQPGITQRRVERIFIWDGDHIIAETDSTGTERFAEYGYLPGIDRPFALVTDSVPGTGSITRFFHQDELGNVIGLTRGNNIEQRIDYDPWGGVSSITGTVADTSRLRWKGLFWEGGNTRLYYMRNRWYDPEARRFTSQDPIGISGGLNHYAFADNDPINYSDPLGLDKCKEGAGPEWTDVYVEGSGWWCYRAGGGQFLPPVVINGKPDFPPPLPDAPVCAACGFSGSDKSAGGLSSTEAAEVFRQVGQALAPMSDAQLVGYAECAIRGTLGTAASGAARNGLMQAVLEGGNARSIAGRSVEGAKLGGLGGWVVWGTANAYSCSLTGTSLPGWLGRAMGGQRR
jgi:RHS repeat-associated protein